MVFAVLLAIECKFTESMSVVENGNGSIRYKLTSPAPDLLNRLASTHNISCSAAPPLYVVTGPDSGLLL